MKAKKLIEVALPIKEISAESVRDKYVHTGHLSTLHSQACQTPISRTLRELSGGRHIGFHFQISYSQGA